MFLFSSYLPLVIQKREEKRKLYTFFHPEKDTVRKSADDYTMVLEIPSISLRVGIYAKDHVKNSIAYGVMNLPESSDPSSPNSKLYFASHSGNSLVSYFQNLKSVQVGDVIYFYDDCVKYTYKVIKKELQKKDGFLKIPKIEGEILFLTTCFSHNQQLLVIASQIKKEQYFTL